MDVDDLENSSQDKNTDEDSTEAAEIKNSNEDVTRLSEDEQNRNEPRKYLEDTKHRDKDKRRNVDDIVGFIGKKTESEASRYISRLKAYEEIDQKRRRADAARQNTAQATRPANTTPKPKPAKKDSNQKSIENLAKQRKTAEKPVPQRSESESGRSTLSSVPSDRCGRCGKKRRRRRRHSSRRRRRRHGCGSRRRRRRRKRNCVRACGRPCSGRRTSCSCKRRRRRRRKRGCGCSK